MKNLALSLVLVLSTSIAQAGKMKEIWFMTNESVAEEMGLDEGVYSIGGHRFVKIEGVDLAVETTVNATYAAYSWTCVTTYKNADDFYEVIGTQCTKNKK